MAFENSQLQSEEKEVSYKDTLNLPRTEFPIRPHFKESDPQLIARWTKENLFLESFEHNKGKEVFLLHDGPPFANGHIHLGSSLNKILKDITTKSQRMLGKHVPVTPGWDCHGLPIELKVTAASLPTIGPVALKKACREYAKKWISIQREEFKQLGILMDWDRYYSTMSPEYEAAIVRAFGLLLSAGYIERKKKTVPWCFSCKTVLAAAEIEYEERKDPSLYVLFPLVFSQFSSLIPQCADKPLSLVIWTTTPWTLPLNRAVTYHPGAEYQILDVGDKYVIVGKERVEDFCKTLEINKDAVGELSGKDLSGIRAQHPLIENYTVPLIASDLVSRNEGTGFVHCAPGAGPEDYEIGVKHSLEIFSPITADGRYSREILPKELAEKSLTDGQGWVIKTLTENDLLLHKTSIRHQYPHCWRCHNGLIFRATKQWFCNLNKHDLRERALQIIEHITFVPSLSRNRLRSTMGTRMEWCISRQRTWGVPIPALVCTACDESYTQEDFIEKVATGIARDGIEYWDSVEIEELSRGLSCASCGNTSFAKEGDILDVWFESGLSHTAVLRDNPALEFPATIYLEGSDQHRGWFQSSLLTSVALYNEAPMRIIYTHGFTVDEKGRKMSKSIGNVVTPQEIIEKIGTDGLRLWVASVASSSEAMVLSEAALKNVQEVFRKIRNTCRFLLANLYDFSIQQSIAFSKLLLIDRYALERLGILIDAISHSYKRFDFTAAYHLLGDYCATDLSALYLDIIKDRLYTEKADGLERRSAQTVCYAIVDSLAKLSAPILSFTAEHVSDEYMKGKKNSIHLHEFPTKTTYENLSPLSSAHWDFLFLLRSRVLKKIEELRENKMVRHSLEAAIAISYDGTQEKGIQFEEIVEIIQAQKQQSSAQFFKEFFIVSHVSLEKAAVILSEEALPGISLVAITAPGNKCPRCWQWDTTNHRHSLCIRCQKVLE